MRKKKCRKLNEWEKRDMKAEWKIYHLCPCWPPVFHHFRSARWKRISVDHLPLTVEIATRVPRRGGGWRSNSLVVILHLEPDWSPQSPKNIEQALKDQLPLFLLGENKDTHMVYGAQPSVLRAGRLKISGGCSTRIHTSLCLSWRFCPS